MGWEPTEFHAHEYDDAGRLIRTIVTREPEWDDHERAKMQALTEYEAKVCDCGFHESVADTDPDLELVFRTCPVCAGTAQQMRVIAAQDDKAVEKLGKTPAPEAVRPDDGRHIGLRRKMPAQPTDK